MPRVLIARGHLVTPWELRPWLELPKRYEVRCLLTASNQFQAPPELRYVEARSLRDLLPAGRLGEIATGVIGDRYLAADEAFGWADIVHAEELSFWFAADAARRRTRGGFRLVQTVWETLPLLDTFRNRHARRNRSAVLAHTDLFLPTTERAALALRLEGVEDERIRVCPPGVDLSRFAPSEASARGEASTPAEPSAPGEPSAPAEKHVLISAGRLVWEKGHQDVLRALALLHRGLVKPRDGLVRPHLEIVGSGPERDRLLLHARELGLEGFVTITGVPYEEMPSRFARASALVLASLPAAMSPYHLFDVPRVFWEEQFGMVLAEAMAAGLDIVASTSGAIPEVLAGTEARLVVPGDWPAIAASLAEGPLSRPPGTRVAYPPAAVERYSTAAAARRLAGAYDELLAGR